MRQKINTYKAFCNDIGGIETKISRWSKTRIELLRQLIMVQLGYNKEAIAVIFQHYNLGTYTYGYWAPVDKIFFKNALQRAQKALKTVIFKDKLRRFTLGGEEDCKHWLNMIYRAGRNNSTYTILENAAIDFANALKALEKAEAYTSPECEPVILGLHHRRLGISATLVNKLDTLGCATVSDVIRHLDFVRESISAKQNSELKAALATFGIDTSGNIYPLRIKIATRKALLSRF